MELPKSTIRRSNVFYRHQLSFLNNLVRKFAEKKFKLGKQPKAVGLPVAVVADVQFKYFTGSTELNNSGF